jgi:hypothetical protein
LAHAKAAIKKAISDKEKAKAKKSTDSFDTGHNWWAHGATPH